MKRNDLILTSAILLIALVWFLITNITGEKGSVLNIYSDNAVVESLSLDSDFAYTVNVSGREVMVIDVKGGRVDVVSADCPDKLCVHQKSISKNNETIVCLPNKIVLEISSQTGGELDAVTY